MFAAFLAVFLVLRTTLAQCSITVVEPQPTPYFCGGKGTLTNPATITTGGASDYQHCAFLCANTLRCVSFAFTTKTGGCQLLKKSLINQGYADHKTPTGVVHYNRHCFKFNPACIINFHLRATSPGTPVDQTYISKVAYAPGNNGITLNSTKSAAIICTLNGSPSQLICTNTNLAATVRYDGPGYFSFAYLDTPAVIAAMPDPSQYMPLYCAFSGSGTDTGLEYDPIGVDDTFYALLTGAPDGFSDLWSLGYAILDVENPPTSYVVAFYKEALFAPQ